MRLDRLHEKSALDREMATGYEVDMRCALRALAQEAARQLTEVEAGRGPFLADSLAEHLALAAKSDASARVFRASADAYDEAARIAAREEAGA